jgi:predicted hotdog family 3-hydroxylacyl-ACP dehydratase
VTWPALAELLPHAPPMRLLARIVEHTRDATTCELEVAASALFADAAGAIPGWLALEWMAQCAAAHGGLAARALGAPPAQGLLVGARRLALARPTFAADEKLYVTARWVGAAGALASFECEVRDAHAVVASGSLSVVVGDFAGRPAT